VGVYLVCSVIYYFFWGFSFLGRCCGLGVTFFFFFSNLVFLYARVLISTESLANRVVCGRCLVESIALFSRLTCLDIIKYINNTG
jgi:hypothetical protein